MITLANFSGMARYAMPSQIQTAAVPLLKYLGASQWVTTQIPGLVHEISPVRDFIALVFERLPTSVTIECPSGFLQATSMILGIQLRWSTSHIWEVPIIFTPRGRLATVFLPRTLRRNRVIPRRFVSSTLCRR
jgi:hypothetical protein